MILGILAIFPGCCCGLLGVPLSIAAIVTGSIGMKNPEGKGMAIAGIVLGVVGLAFIVLAIILNVGMNGANRFK